MRSYFDLLNSDQPTGTPCLLPALRFPIGAVGRHYKATSAAL